MKAHMLEVHTSTTRNPIIAQNQMLLTMVQMVNAKVALKAWVNWKTILGGQGTNLSMYWAQMFPPHLPIVLKPILFKSINCTLVNGGHGTTWESSSNSMVINWIVECPCEQNPPPHSLRLTFLLGSKHRWSHGWKLGGPRVNGSKLGGCSWNDIIGSHLGHSRGILFFDMPCLIPTRYPLAIMGKNGKQWKKPWIFTLCNALSCKHYLNCAHFSFTSCNPLF